MVIVLMKQYLILHCNACCILNLQSEAEYKTFLEQRTKNITWENMDIEMHVKRLKKVMHTFTKRTFTSA